MIEIHEDIHKHYSIYKPADDKNPVTGYYLTIDEYNELESSLATARYNESNAKSKLKELENIHLSETEKIKENYIVQLDLARSNIEGEYYQKLMDEREQRIQSQKSAQTEAELNRNFKRIARERANKKRKIDKHEPGYLFLDWKSTTYQPRNIDNPITIPLYISNIQTPWDCSLPLADVDHLTVKDISTQTLIILKESSVFYFEDNISLDEAVQSYTDINDNSIGCILTRKYKSNAKSGLWEVTLYTTFEPTIVERHRKYYV